MMYVFGMFIFGILLFTLALYVNKDEANEKINKKSKFLESVNQNSNGKCKIFINREMTNGIGIDELNKKIHILSPTRNFIYDFNDIIKSEIVIDNQSVISTNRGSQLVGIAVGGILAGGIGAIIGGLSGGKISKQEIRNVELKLTINDLSNTTFKINFLSPVTKVGWSKDSTRVKNSISEIEKWQGYFDIILKQ
jgi:hypothetical protein